MLWACNEKDSRLEMAITQGYVSRRSVRIPRRRIEAITESVGLRLMSLYELLKTDTNR